MVGDQEVTRRRDN